MTALDHQSIDLKGLTLQRFMIEALRDEDAAYDYDPSGNFLSFSHDGYDIKFNGFGLVGTDIDFAGTTTDFVVEGPGGSITGLFIVAPEYNALYEAAEAGKGDANPLNYADFYDLFVPEGHFLIVTGDGKANVAEGSNGDDFADLGKNADTWIAGLGMDSVIGGGGFDMALGLELPAGFDFNLGSGEFQVFGGLESSFTGFENAKGSPFGDSITGNRKANWLFGEGGDDLLSGRDGNDWLNGGRGRDRLDDGLGSDWLIGGLGRDQFLFRPEAGDNTITDFDPLRDILNVRRFHFETFEQFIGLASNVGANVVIEYGAGFGGGSLELFDISTADLAGNVRF